MTNEKKDMFSRRGTASERTEESLSKLDDLRPYLVFMGLSHGQMDFFNEKVATYMEEKGLGTVHLESLTYVPRIKNRENAIGILYGHCGSLRGDSYTRGWMAAVHDRDDSTTNFPVFNRLPRIQYSKHLGRKDNGHPNTTEIATNKDDVFSFIDRAYEAFLSKK